MVTTVGSLSLTQVCPSMFSMLNAILTDCKEEQLRVDYVGTLSQEQEEQEEETGPYFKLNERGIVKD